MSNTEYVKKRPSSKGFAILPVIIVVAVIIFVGVFVFDNLPIIKQPPEGMSQDEHKEWIAEQTYQTVRNKGFVNIGYEEPTQEELDQLKEQVDLTRKYPRKIHALFEIGRNTVPLIHFVDELKDLGINTYVVQAEINLQGGKLKLFQPGYTTIKVLSQEAAKRIVVHRMLLAKQAGFAVSFVPDYPELFEFGKKKYDIDKFEPQYIAIALEWAKIAEEYGLEYFSPVNEYEKLLESNGYDLDFIYERTNAFYEKLMPQLREIYSGKIIIKTGHLGDWENHRNLSFKDADFVGVGVWYALPADAITQDIKDMVRVMDEISQRDNTPWLITEYYNTTPEEAVMFFKEDQIPIPMGEAYQAGLTEFKKAKRAVGFIFTGYLGGGRIRGTEAVPVLKEYYSRY